MKKTYNDKILLQEIITYHVTNSERENSEWIPPESRKPRPYHNKIIDLSTELQKPDIDYFGNLIVGYIVRDVVSKLNKDDIKC